MKWCRYKNQIILLLEKVRYLYILLYLDCNLRSLFFVVLKQGLIGFLLYKNILYRIESGVTNNLVNDQFLFRCGNVFALVACCMNIYFPPAHKCSCSTDAT